MDNAYFLITDLGEYDGSHHILHSLTCAQINSEVLVFVRDFGKIKTLREEFPSAIFIQLDQSRNVDINKELCRLLPEMDCYLNFTGDVFTNVLKSIEEIQLAKESAFSQDAVTLEAISQALNNTDNAGAVLINIIPHASGSKLCNIFKKEDYNEEPYGPQRTPVIFRPRSKFVKHPPSRESTQAAESQPLLSRSFNKQEEEPETGFFSCLFCFCYPYCCATDTGVLVFESPEQLRCHIRMEKTSELRQSLEKLFETSEYDWNKIVKQLVDKENMKLEELVLKVKDKKSLEETELNREKDAQNSATVTNLSGVLDEKTIEKIQKSRERHVKKKVGWDTETAYKEGAIMIHRAAEMEKVIKTDEHYSKVLLQQFDILTTLNEKYNRKYDRLFLKNFGKSKNV